MSVFCVLLVLMVSPASAIEIYINGVHVGAVADIEMSNCTVRFDQAGNLHITAPGYEVSAPPGAGTNTNAQRPKRELTGQYYLIARSTNPSEVGYEVELLLNGEPFRTITPSSEELMVSLNSSLLLGKNRLGIRAVKKGGASKTKDASLEIYVGEGLVEGSSGDLKNVFVRYKRRGHETEDFDEEKYFVAN